MRYHLLFSKETLFLNISSTYLVLRKIYKKCKYYTCATFRYYLIYLKWMFGIELKNCLCICSFFYLFHCFLSFFSYLFFNCTEFLIVQNPCKKNLISQFSAGLLWFWKKAWKRKRLSGRLSSPVNYCHDHLKCNTVE